MKDEDAFSGVRLRGPHAVQCRQSVWPHLHAPTKLWVQSPKRQAQLCPRMIAVVSATQTRSVSSPLSRCATLQNRWHLLYARPDCRYKAPRKHARQAICPRMMLLSASPRRVRVVVAIRVRLPKPLYHKGPTSTCVPMDDAREHLCPGIMLFSASSRRDHNHPPREWCKLTDRPIRHARVSM
jgi:hypothetical protein